MNANEIINQVMDSAQKIVNKYTYPVFVSDLKRKPDLLASSVIIELDSEYFLVTASHVLLEVLSINSQFIIGVNGKYQTVVGEFTHSNVEEGIDNFDIAYIPISKNFVEKNEINVLKEEMIVMDKSRPIPHIAFIHGFPNSMNKQSKALYNTTSFKVKAYAYGGVIKNDFPYWGECKKLVDVHTCMTYGMKSDKNMARHPGGISGGGLWVVPKYSEPEVILLDSIFIEYHKTYSVTFSTKISEVVSFIKSTKA